LKGEKMTHWFFRKTEFRNSQTAPKKIAHVTEVTKIIEGQHVKHTLTLVSADGIQKSAKTIDTYTGYDRSVKKINIIKKMLTDYVKEI